MKFGSILYYEIVNNARRAQIAQNKKRKSKATPEEREQGKKKRAPEEKPAETPQDNAEAEKE